MLLLWLFSKHCGSQTSGLARTLGKGDVVSAIEILEERWGEFWG
jgi:hypothetical protein